MLEVNGLTLKSIVMSTYQEYLKEIEVSQGEESVRITKGSNNIDVKESSENDTGN